MKFQSVREIIETSLQHDHSITLISVVPHQVIYKIRESYSDAIDKVENNTIMLKNGLWIKVLPILQSCKGMPNVWYLS